MRQIFWHKENWLIWKNTILYPFWNWKIQQPSCINVRHVQTCFWLVLHVKVLCPVGNLSSVAQSGLVRSFFLFWKDWGPGLGLDWFNFWRTGLELQSFQDWMRTRTSWNQSRTICQSWLVLWSLHAVLDQSLYVFLLFYHYNNLYIYLYWFHHSVCMPRSYSNRVNIYYELVV